MKANTDKPTKRDRMMEEFNTFLDQHSVSADGALVLAAHDLFDALNALCSPDVKAHDWDHARKVLGDLAARGGYETD